MKRDPAALARTEFDVVVVGGGVYGLSAAWEAAARGLRTALLERADFGHAASAGSYKLVHGGLRYLQHLDFARMRVSIGERRRMLHMAPHLVYPLEFLLPCYGHGIKGPEAMRAALAVNDLVAFDRNRGLPERQHIPRGRVLSRRECLRRLPLVRPDGLTGAAVFYDAQMYHSERLTLAFALSAHDAGAHLLNYAEAEGFLLRNGRVEGVRARDRLSDTTFDVRGRITLNMTGAWSDITLGLRRPEGRSRRVVRSKGVQLFTRPLPGGAAFAFESGQVDRTAVVARGNRMYFVTPWRGVSFFGTTDDVYEGDPDDYAVTEDDIERYLAEINAALPGAGLGREDVLSWCGGLRPIEGEGAGRGEAGASHKTEVVDHARTDAVEGLITTVGVKYTTCRHVAEQAVRAAAAKLGRKPRPSPTRDARLHGGDIPDPDAFFERARRDLPWDPQIAERLARHYGTDVDQIAAAARKDTEPFLPGPGRVLRAEVLHAAREEMAVTLADTVFRRTDLGALGHPGMDALEAAARAMAPILSWDDARTRSEVERVDALFAPGARPYNPAPHAS